jgi:DNA-binding MarR family transcriptional regulator
VARKTTIDTQRFDDAHLEAVANGRYLMRRAFRIIDQEARRTGVDPLAFQALVQLAGLPSRTRTVSDLAVRLDVPRGLASRLASSLEEVGLVQRIRSPGDKRVTLVQVTDEGMETVQAVFGACRRALEVLQDDLEYDKRAAALRQWARNFAVEGVLARPELRGEGRAGGSRDRPTGS